MKIYKSYQIVIIGGGLAGLSAALHLSQANLDILLIEKHPYPNHKVCGEYVSNEVLEYLDFLGVSPFEVGAKKISNFEVSNTNGSLIKAELPLGGFGISRYALDNLLYEALDSKIDVVFDTVKSVTFSNELFTIDTKNEIQFTSTYVVGAFGKRSNIDTFLGRQFIQNASPWLAVKAHYTYDFPEDTVALHNFVGGYCGLSKTETDVVNACYLTTYKSFKRFGKIPEFQENVLAQNPYLKDFFENAIPEFEKPLTISQISFEVKQPVEDHIFMLGDSAGLIHPLCGNGMAMAIHSAKLFSEVFLEASANGNIDRKEMEHNYETLWKKTFSKRLKSGRKIQSLLLHPTATRVGFSIAKLFPNIVPAVIKRTHGSTI
ncbi:NAD(P)/FAD-dependent oxidoreductase [Ulvibacter antarcticus]|uniref:Flavin-dependent dehydrogenase n=1 Tax=Ulvibacter antarcticus TaxID=442714 RepID=A0A3L9Z1P4_9FLAO|nr:NAD(P)/FAD-dependent oxidoreductase [Ulvibacter antarcticus]RMA64268.1 flavin-dependent dehydrogenase [Ulvibacter antarcticus]